MQRGPSFATWLQGAVQKDGTHLYAWVILADHNHLLFRTNDVTPVWKFIKRLPGTRAIRLNRLDRTEGRQVWYQYWDSRPRNEGEF